jgi:hypothetical protein
MKTLGSRILAATFIAFIAITVSTSTFAGNGNGPSTQRATNATLITTQDVINYLASQGIKATSISPANDGTSNVIATTASGAQITVYISGDQFLGHDDLPQ